MATHTLPTRAANSNDAALEAAWRRRLEALETYNGLPYGPNDETTADEAAQWAIIDEAEEVIRSTVATTPRGAAIQLWASLAHCIMTRDEEVAISRADLAYLNSRDTEMDWNARLALAALRSLEAMEARP